MRIDFKKILFEKMQLDKNIIFFTADLGYGFLDEIKNNFPDRFYNVGSDEFLMLNIGVAFALDKKIPICFSITPFLLWRPSEVIRLYLNHEKIPVKLLSSGRDNDYKNQGFTHDATDAKSLLDLFPNIVQFWPENKENLIDMIDQFLYNGQPSHLNLKR